MGSNHNLSGILNSSQNKPKYLNPNNFSIPNLEIFNNSLRDARYIWDYSLNIDIKSIFKGVI